ncbi:MAG: TIGR04013 family B12-binding domain/radical SAM domain-containing protein [Ignisphaera sp.]
MHMYDVCLAILYGKSNKYTVNVLTAAVETYYSSAKVYLLRFDKGYGILEDVLNIKRKCHKIVVGFTFMTHQIDVILRILVSIKQILPNALYIAGGPHASGDPLGTLTKLGFDLVVYGEGEATLIDILEAINNNEDPKVCGTAYIEDDTLVIRRRPFINLDAYPPFPYWRNLFNPIEIMRGCSASCYFCQVSYMFGPPRYRSIENILYYSKIMMERGLKDLRFIAPNSFGYGSNDGIKPAPDKLLELLQKLREQSNSYGGRIFFGTFPSEVRPDSVEEDIVKCIRKLVDNKRIIIGGQSGSKKVLHKIHRRHDVDTIVNAVDILTRNGFEVDVDLILGFEFEDDDDIIETINLINKLKKYKTRIHLHTFIPLPGTPFSSMRFKSINENIRRYLFKLVGEGRAYGDWIDQEKIAQYIISLREKEIIYDIDKYAGRIKIIDC